MTNPQEVRRGDGSSDLPGDPCQILTATKDVAIGPSAENPFPLNPKPQILVVQDGVLRSPPMSSRLQAALERYFEELQVPHLPEQVR